MERIRLLVVDDDILVREGICALIEQYPDFLIVAQANNGFEALELTRKYHPDIVLMDIGMARMNGLEATSFIKQQFEEVKVLILSMYSREEYVLNALRAGASGYLLKNAEPAELLLALRTIGQGKTYFTTFEPRTESNVAHQLTQRQREILRFICEGRTNREMAQILNISPKTVDTHRTQLMCRLNIHDLAGLVRFAIKEGLVPN
jgi:DNA-binding NarL/FixJ family response regulator